eukprot:TRINITY_DN8525_c0_g1_i1.p2 TRINITY_DN8525_c0_g1~~TRINITY_DN8525_c0_g1_i1.p2  ORF type:complete len:355 (+),score=134.46 TRINITY_DN8525_c0_g1_i1:120-1184(+)
MESSETDSSETMVHQQEAVEQELHELRLKMSALEADMLALQIKHMSLVLAGKPIQGKESLWKSYAIQTLVLLKRLASTTSGWLVIWLSVAIVGSGAALFLILVGAAHAPNRDDDALWIEANSQVLNGIFTYMTISTHPLRVYWAYLWFTDFERLVRWQEWGRGMKNKVGLVLLILNVQVFFQYGLTIVMWGWPASTRPNAVVGTMLPLSFLCSILAGVLEGKFKNEWKKQNEAELTHLPQLSTDPAPQLATVKPDGSPAAPPSPKFADDSPGSRGSAERGTVDPADVQFVRDVLKSSGYMPYAVSRAGLSASLDPSSTRSTLGASTSSLSSNDSDSKSPLRPRTHADLRLTMPF